MIAVLRENYSGPFLSKAKAEITEYLSNSLVSFLVLETKGVVGFVGYAQSWMDWDSYEVFWMNIAKSCQGKGHGRQLAEALIRKLEQRKAQNILLWTDKEDFWGKFGFVQYAPGLMRR